MTDYAKKIPDGAAYALEKLNDAGFQACLVGGCVRDLIREKDPHDWDICTSATPDRVHEIFKNHGIIDTGLQHGTVTLRVNHESYEITTYRIDGDYADGRHPDGVTFTMDLEQDLARRDFTINSIAMDKNGDVHDPYHGKEDIEDHMIRCTGNPDAKFREDGLRLMRALRFASVFDYQIHPETAAAIHENARMLDKIAAERIRAELEKLLSGAGAAAVLREYPDIVCRFWPELGDTIRFDQKNPWHRYDVWEHTLHALEAAPADPVIRFAVLLHDIGKPSCMTEDADGIRHFHGHPGAGAAMSDDMLRRLRFDNETRKRIVKLVAAHDTDIPATERSVRKTMSKMGADCFFQYIQVRRADVSAQAKAVGYRLAALDKIEAIARDIIDAGACLSVKDLAVDGRDVIAAGVPEGPAVGRMLDALLQQVLSGKLPNERPVLEQEVARMAENRRT